MNPNDIFPPQSPAATQESPPTPPVQASPPQPTPYDTPSPSSIPQASSVHTMSVASTPGEQNPYAFIMNPAPAPKHSFLGGDNKALKLLVIVAGATFVIIVLAVILTSVLSKSSPDATLTTLAQEQTELIRVATQGETQAAAESTKGFAYNIDLSIGTNQQQLLAYLSKHGVKIKEKQLTLKQDASTDTLLTSAKATSTYDSALQKVLNAQLETYITDIQKAYKGARSTELKTLLTNSFNAAKTLLIQGKGTTEN